MYWSLLAHRVLARRYSILKNGWNFGVHYIWCRMSWVWKYIALELSMKSPQKDETVGLILLWEKFLLRARWLIVYWSLLARCVLVRCNSILKKGWNFVTASFYLSNFEKILGSIIGYAHRARCLKSRIDLCNVSLARPSHVGQTRKPSFYSPRSLFVFGKLSMKNYTKTYI